MKLGILLKRKPMITPPLNPFEFQYLSHRNHIRRLDSKEFEKEFYFKKGTFALERWNSANGNQPVDQEYVNWVESNKSNFDESVTSLNRKLSETLYLLTKSASGFKLPMTSVKESLHQTAQEYIDKLGKLKHFIPSQIPCGHYDDVFVIKSHLLQGKITVEHQWLTAEEIENLDGDYYNQIKHFL
jgi:hypothetical protein